MPFGDTAKKLQKVTDMAEDVYSKLNELRTQVHETQEAVAETNERVGSLEAEVAEQRALMEAIATEHGIDVEAVTAAVHVEDAEEEGDTESAADESTGA